MSVNAVREGGKIKEHRQDRRRRLDVGHARPDSTIKSIDDLRGKTIATLKFPSSTIQVPTFAIKTVGKFDPKEGWRHFHELPPGAQAAAVKTDGLTSQPPLNGDVSIAANSSAWCRCCPLAT